MKRTNLIFQRGVAPLHLACRHGHVQVARLLVDHGADPNLLSKAGLTPFHLAARHGHEAVVELLLDKGGLYSVVKVAALVCTG